MFLVRLMLLQRFCVYCILLLQSLYSSEKVQFFSLFLCVWLRVLSLCWNLQLMQQLCMVLLWMMRWMRLVVLVSFVWFDQCIGRQKFEQNRKFLSRVEVILCLRGLLLWQQFVMICVFFCRFGFLIDQWNVLLIFFVEYSVEKIEEQFLVCIDFMNVMFVQMVFLCGVIVLGMSEMVLMVFWIVLRSVSFVNMCIVRVCFLGVSVFYDWMLFDSGIFLGSQKLFIRWFQILRFLLFWMWFQLIVCMLLISLSGE